ncbi:uncharacterized protein LOC141631797 [Silene latifolia]|uniref:uncharacterized protein LOC141631797 n=1 Tax=Silene latifolia TaxID=37657 RepID=UPI003D7859B7
MKGRYWYDYSPTLNSSWVWRTICKVKDRVKAGFINDVWCANRGQYTVASGYDWLQEDLVKVDWWPLIWNRLNLPKYTFIGWLMIQERLFTKDRMLRFGVLTDGLCEICWTQMEDHHHLFYLCDFSSRCWNLLRAWLGVPLPTNDVLQWCNRWRSRSLLKKQLVHAAVVALIYHIWMARNVCREEHRVPCPNNIVKEIRCYSEFV